MTFLHERRQEKPLKIPTEVYLEKKLFLSRVEDDTPRLRFVRKSLTGISELLRYFVSPKNVLEINVLKKIIISIHPVKWE